jgi:hypothetical protein
VRVRLPLLTLLAALLAAIAAGQASAAPPAQRSILTFDRLFAADSVWNKPLPANAPVDRSSWTMMTALRTEIARQRRLRVGPWIQTRDSTTPLYIVRKRQRTQRVKIDVPQRPWYQALHRAFRRVPIPRRMRASLGSDRVLTIWQPSRDRLWELWRARRRSDGWHAQWGGAIRNISRNPGYYTSSAWPGARTNWGAAATSLPLIAGTMRLLELRRGYIDHALAMAVPDARAGVFAWPAQRTDGRGGPTLLPEGARLRLDPNLDLDSLQLPPVTRMMAEAAQRYGIVVRDRTKQAVTFFMEDLTPWNDDPYRGPGGLFRGASPRELLASFPWEHVHVLKMSLCRRAPCPRGDAP